MYQTVSVLLRDPDDKTTVCHELKKLYTRALQRGDATEIKEIETAFILAKKMNKRLVEYKFGYAVTKAPESEQIRLFGNMDTWQKELEGIREYINHV